MKALIRALGAKERAIAACGKDDLSARTCVVTRAVLPPDALIRFVAGPNGEVTPDLARKLPGRGVWVTCRRDVVAKAAKLNSFSRGLKAKVTVPDGLTDRVEALLVKRAIELLSICNKAGLVATGSGKVNSWLEAGAQGALVQGADASPDGLAKVARKYRAIRESTDRVPLMISLLTINELSLAMGRANVVHAALSEGTAATNFLAAANRVELFRAADSSEPTLDGAPQAATGQSQVNGTTGQV